ncbi:MAG TPA: serine/threonine-protein kinase, partial [Polyangiaceae bacterium]
MRLDTGLARTVALKRMHPHFATDPDFVAMFFDEARLAMRLQHPNIVPTFDVVSTDTELLLVMEYIHGESLAGLLRASRAAGQRVPPAVASAIVCGVLAGLHAAHEACSEDGAPLAIVHRDVSPQNVMVGVDGVARLLDFGIAKAAGRVHSTAQGQVKGKFAYMAPEQLTTEEVDRRADVFAAAVVLWETLTGSRLFRGETPGALVNAVMTADIAPPSTVAPGVPAAVDAVVMRGLARQKRERYATARDMALALEAALPPATTRVVGDWAETLAAAALTKRAGLVKEVESSGAVAAPDLALPAAARPSELSGRDEMPSAAFPPEEHSVAGVGKPAATRKSGRTAWPMGIAAVAIIATAVLAGVALVRSERRSASASASVPA